MTHYLIEFRFQGKAKSEIRNLIYKIDNKFNLGIVRDKRPIPHITLVGPIQTQKERQLIKDFKMICSNTPFSSFRINGYGYFENSNVIFINITPSGKLDIFRWELANKLDPYCGLRPFDYKREFSFHATLAMHLTDSKFYEIKKYIDNLDPPHFEKHFLIRATLIKNSKILYEYDFLQRKLLTRNEALNPKIYSKSIELLKKFFRGQYDPDSKISHYPIKPSKGTKIQKVSFFTRMRLLLRRFLKLK